MINEVFIEQEKSGTIKKIGNIYEFRKFHPNHSFLPHMAVFKMDKATSKCRMFFLSNLSEGKPSHFVAKSCDLPWPKFKSKISTALLHSRFGEELLTHDLRKAFHQISLSEDLLLFLWYKDVMIFQWLLIVTEFRPQSISCYSYAFIVRDSVFGLYSRMPPND